MIKSKTHLSPEFPFALCGEIKTYGRDFSCGEIKTDRRDYFLFRINLTKIDQNNPSIVIERVFKIRHLSITWKCKKTLKKTKHLLQEVKHFSL